jgi:hypothetical protein
MGLFMPKFYFSAVQIARSSHWSHDKPPAYIGVNSLFLHRWLTTSICQNKDKKGKICFLINLIFLFKNGEFKIVINRKSRLKLENEEKCLIKDSLIILLNFYLEKSSTLKTCENVDLRTRALDLLANGEGVVQPVPVDAVQLVVNADDLEGLGPIV